MLRPSFLVIVLLIWLSGSFGFAQKSIRLAGHDYKIMKFKQDTVGKTKSLSDLTLPLPIEKSSYELEIRCYSFGLPVPNWHVLVIKGSKDSLFAEQYEIYSAPPRPGYKIVSMKNKQEWYLYYKKLTKLAMVDTILRKMITHHIFNMTDQYKVYQDLSKRRIKFVDSVQPYDCCSDEYIEVKLNRKYRSFRYNPYPAMYNSQIYELNEENKLMKNFGELYDAMRNLSFSKY